MSLINVVDVKSGGLYHDLLHCYYPYPRLKYLTTIEWIMKFCTDIHGPQRVKPTDFGDPLTIPLAPPAGQNVYFG